MAPLAIQVGEAEYESPEYESQERGAERKEQNPLPQAMAPGEYARLIEAGTCHGQSLGIENRIAKRGATLALKLSLGNATRRRWPVRDHAKTLKPIFGGLPRSA